MKIITAVEQYTKSSNDITVFLGGGITNCRDWQRDVITKLSAQNDLDNLIVFNPRRENFPIHDPSASEEQINWEFKYLMECDIFSMFFCQDTNSDQPICMYELGRYIPIKLQQNKQIVITSEPNYKRIKDVEIQSKLAFNDSTYQINNDINQHIDAIINAYNTIKNKDQKPMNKNNKKIINENDIQKFINSSKTINESKKSILNLNLNGYKNIDNVGLVFENKTFSNCDFSNSQLYNIIYKNCNIINCNFNSSCFNDVIFENCEIGKSTFINIKSNNNPFKNCKFIQCEQVELNQLNFDYIEKFLTEDKRFTKIENGVYQIDIPEYNKTLNVLIMKNQEIGSENCDISVYITPKADNIKQLTPLFITYDFDRVAFLFQTDDFCNSFIADIIQSINLKYKPIINDAIDQLQQLTNNIEQTNQEKENN